MDTPRFQEDLLRVKFSCDTEKILSPYIVPSETRRTFVWGCVVNEEMQPIAVGGMLQGKSRWIGDGLHAPVRLVLFPALGSHTLSLRRLKLGKEKALNVGLNTSQEAHGSGLLSGLSPLGTTALRA